MTTKTKLLISVLTVGVIGVAATGTTTVMAQNNGSYQSFVAELAQKLGLDQTKVQQAFDSIKSDNQAKRQVTVQSKLDQAVKDGKLTDAQKQLILNKIQEIKSQVQTDMQNWKNMAPQQRRDQMKKRHDDITAWAKQNGIDMQYVFGMRGRMRWMK
jgi:hypothetical protein